MVSLFDIFISFIKIGALAFGGAYAAIPLVESEVVTVRGWMTYQEFANLLALDELTPGPILINSATFVGMKMGGVWGAIVATLGCIIPAMTISLILTLIYKKYKNLSTMQSIMNTLKCMAIALIASSFFKMFVAALFFDGNIALNNIRWLSIPLMVASFVVLRKKKINPIIIMLVCGAVNLAVSLI